jgi:hypothetical protein
VLKITLPAVDMFDDAKQEFTASDEVVLELEHSLVSLGVWESKWEQPFLGPKEKTREQTLDYVNSMVLGGETPPDLFSRLTDDHIEAINAYINAKMTATTFNEAGSAPKKGATEIITAELVYYWMIKLEIPFECQYWHLERLLTLIKVCTLKNSPPKKMSRAEVIAQQRALNAQRKAQLGTAG